MLSNPIPIVTLTLAALVSGCGHRLLDRWSGEPILAYRVAAPADSLWIRIAERARALDLVVAGIHPGDRIVQFDWVTTPGDGRLYLRCGGEGVVGSASLRPRVRVRDTGDGSEVVISTEVRATAASGCRSNGHFEEWLLGRFAPAIADARPAEGPTSTGRGDGPADRRD
jgi:hypothetical protein